MKHLLILTLILGSGLSNAADSKCAQLTIAAVLLAHNHADQKTMDLELEHAKKHPTHAARSACENSDAKVCKVLEAKECL